MIDNQTYFLPNDLKLFTKLSESAQLLIFWWRKKYGFLSVDFSPKAPVLRFVHLVGCATHYNQMHLKFFVNH